MRGLIATTAAMLGVVALGVSVQDPTPLSVHEGYLAAYADELVDYRENPIAKRFIKLANLVDIVPTWLMDMFVPLLIPHSTLALPLHVKVPIPLPFGPFDGIPPDILHIQPTHFSINELDEFKRLKPIKFQDDTRFTWKGHIIWKNDTAVTLKIGTKLVLFNTFEMETNISLTVTSPGVDFGLILAFDREKMCNVWGNVMTSSASCAMHPMFLDLEDGVSGVKLAELTLHASDITLNELSMPSMPFGLEKHIEQFLKDVLEHKKSDLLADLATSGSEMARQAVNAGILLEIPLYNKDFACEMDGKGLPSVPDASEVCFNNNAAFAMKWGYANCPTHDVSFATHAFPIDKTKCMAVTDIWPDAKPGSILRGTTEAIAGVHEIIDPAVRYQPDTNRAMFSCSGSTLLYGCDLISVAPLDPSVPAQASQICVLNQAGFVARFNAKALRTGDWFGESTHFPINQRVCLNLSDSSVVAEGDQFQTRVHATGGTDSVVGRIVEYKENGPQITFVCTGSTMDFRCAEMGPPLETTTTTTTVISEASRICVQNQAGFRARFNAKDLRTNKWIQESDHFAANQEECLDFNGAIGVKEGDLLKTRIHATAGEDLILGHVVEFHAEAPQITFVCKGSTMMYHCDEVDARTTTTTSVITTATTTTTVIAKASRICVQNEAGFLAQFNAQDLRTEAWLGKSHHFAKSQKKCLDFSSSDDATEGDQIQTTVSATGGKDLILDLIVEFQAQAPEITFVCTGSTMHYQCATESLLVV